MPKWFLWLDPPGREVIQLHADLWDAHCSLDEQWLSDPAAVGVNHHQAQRLHGAERTNLTHAQMKTKKQET